MRIRRSFGPTAGVVMLVFVLVGCATEEPQTEANDADAGSVTQEDDAQQNDSGEGADREGDAGVDADAEPQDLDALLETAALSRDEPWQASYRMLQGDRKVVVANEPPEMVTLVDGDVTLRVTPQGPMLCSDGDCQLLPMDADAPLGQLLSETLGPAAAAFDVDPEVAAAVEGEPTAGTIADRAATCFTLPASAVDARAADGGETPDELDVCLDNETGVVLRSATEEGEGFEAEELSTSVDPALFEE